MKQGQHYASTDRKIFEILELYTQDQSQWVRYVNTQTHKEYTCLAEAFLARFYLQPS
jgi:hypothetical protein